MEGVCVLLFPTTPGHEIIADTEDICSIIPGIGICLIGEQLRIPALREGITSLIELLADLPWPLCLLCPHPVVRLA